MSSKTSHILYRAEDESWNSFLRKMQATEGELTVVLSSADTLVLRHEEDRTAFLDLCVKIRYRLHLFVKDARIATDAKERSVRVSRSTRALKTLLRGHSHADHVLRSFSPHLWRQQWRSRLQHIGLLSMPKVRIWLLISLSGFFFLFVLFRLLPSARIIIQARREVVTQTMNVMLTQSGSAPGASHVRTLPLFPITATVHQRMTFTQITPEFIGTDAQAQMTIVNAGKEAVGLRAGSRLRNQAGMIFRIQRSVMIPAGGRETVPAKADHLDAYGEFIGERGNVPAGVEWTFPGLDADTGKYVTAKNVTAGKGGKTAQRLVLRKEDIDRAVRELRTKLLAQAEDAIEDERDRIQSLSPGSRMELLLKQDIIRTTYSGFILPTQFIGQTVTSVPIEGSMIYSVPAYDSHMLLDRFGSELTLHIDEGKRLVADSLQIDPQKVIVIEYADDLTWVKITADIAGTEEFILDPLTPTGLTFGKKVRDAVAGLSTAEALRVIKNFPEVDKVTISLWPPWGKTLPVIPANISIVAE